MERRTRGDATETTADDVEEHGSMPRTAALYSVRKTLQEHALVERFSRAERKAWPRGSTGCESSSRSRSSPSTAPPEARARRDTIAHCTRDEPASRTSRARRERLLLLAGGRLDLLLHLLRHDDRRPGRRLRRVDRSGDGAEAARRAEAAGAALGVGERGDLLRLGRDDALEDELRDAVAGVNCEGERASEGGRRMSFASRGKETHLGSPPWRG